MNISYHRQLHWIGDERWVRGYNRAWRMGAWHTIYPLTIYSLFSSGILITSYAHNSVVRNIDEESKQSAQVLCNIDGKPKIKSCLLHDVRRWSEQMKRRRIDDTPCGCFTLFAAVNRHSRHCRPGHCIFRWLNITLEVKRTHSRSYILPAIKWKLLTLGALSTHLFIQTIKLNKVGMDWR